MSVPPLGPKSSAPAKGDEEVEQVESSPVGRAAPHPKVAGLQRVVEKLSPRSPPEPLGILGYVSRVIGGDFLEYSPPEMKAFTLAAIKDARLGKWKKMRALGALLTPKNPLSKEAWKKAFVKAIGKATYEVPPLDEHEIAAVRALLEGPIADLIRARAAAGTPPPCNLKELDQLLESDDLKKRLLELHPHQRDVSAAIAVARTVIEQHDEHFEAVAIDRAMIDRATDASGRLDPEKLDALPPIVRVVLEDPQCGARAIQAARRGSVVTAQVLKKTPEPVLEDLNRFSTSLAGGGFLWINEYVKTGRKLQITPGDVERKRQQLEKFIQRIEDAIPEVKKRMLESKKVTGEAKAAISAALEIEDLGERIARLDQLAARLDGPSRIEAIRFARLATELQKFKTTDPQAILEEIDGKLSRFKDFREEAVKISVDGPGSSDDHGLAGAIRRSDRLKEYGHELLVKTVTYDYANEATESARKIIYGVAGVAGLGLGIHELFGDGLMHSIISIFEDLATDVGEISSMTAQGIPLSEILTGPRFLGQALTLGGAGFIASQAHHFIEAGAAGSFGAGALGGLMLGVGSCALTCYTSIYSYNLFRRVTKELGREGKFDLAQGEDAMVRDAKECLGAVAERAHMPELVPQLQAAFDRVRADYQGVPTGENLARALAELRPDLSAETLTLIRTAQNDVVKLTAAGIDHQEMLRELSTQLSKSFVEMIRQEGYTVDESAVFALISSRLAPLEESMEIDSKKIMEVVKGCFADVIELAAERDPQARSLTAKAESFTKALGANVGELDEKLEKKLRDELKEFARQAGKAQTIANPVRAMLILGIAVCLGSLTVCGALLPAFLLGKIGAGVLATLASSESWVASGGLATRAQLHKRELRRLAEAMAEAARVERLGREMPPAVPVQQ